MLPGVAPALNSGVVDNLDRGVAPCPYDERNACPNPVFLGVPLRRKSCSAAGDMELSYHYY